MRFFSTQGKATPMWIEDMAEFQTQLRLYACPGFQQV